MLSNDLLSGAKAAAEYIGATPRIVYHLCETGSLPCIRKGKRLYFRKSELDRAFTSEVQ
ncbi:helix-turn-helix domain-containing protein [Croceicoccus sp. Ery15]|uniref:helix-turn-helix domain-containing protein n=1 Tax=Croceicoccus sp. Ery15 TaxID=1703338 RepID=UPI001E608596|nr:helix-turn-helix domain-containing protein [Croceicoccus sp. Ery15]